MLCFWRTRQCTMHVQACCCQSSWLKHPFVQEQGEMQRHCSGSSQSHTTPLCSVPFVGLWGKRKLLCGLLVTMPCSQATKGTLVQAGNTQPVVLRWAFALVWGENLFPAYMRSQMCPLKEKEEPYHQGSSSSSSGTTSDIVDRAGLFWVCSLGQFIDGWQEAAPCCSTVSYLA